MSTPDPAGPGRPARLAGLGLLALAAIALVIGLISWIGGGSKPEDSANNPPASSAGSTPPPATTAPSSETPQPPPPSSPASSAVPPPASSSAAPPPAQSPGNNPPAHSQEVRVLNNSLIAKLAENAADDFRGSGFNVVNVGNYSGGTIAVTTVYFRPGTDEEADAKALAKEFGLRVEPRFDGIKDATPGIIVIVTREYKPKTAK
jgi:hypothetical protein